MGKKTRPVCRNETKQNCVTIWNTNPDGEKVWAGENECTPVTWLNCQDEEYDASFESMESVCVDDEIIPYTSTAPANTIQSTCLTKTFTLQRTCVAQPARRVCVKHRYQSCGPNMDAYCIPTNLVEPRQESVHQEKCLFEQNGDEVGKNVHHDHHHEHHDDHGHH